MPRGTLSEVAIARDARTNRRIRAHELRVIDADGAQLGVMPLAAALARAQEQGLDLVEISPLAKPPVCKIMDYGRYKYDQKKKANEAKKKQTVVKLKEIKLRPKTEEHDYAFKIKNVRQFLEEGNKARITIVFRGREITHKEIGQQILNRVVGDVKEVGIVEQAPRMEGRQMFMILAPNPKWKQQQESARARAAQLARQGVQAAVKLPMEPAAPAQAAPTEPKP